MRVAFFTDTFLPKVDGITTVICLLLDHLALRGVETILLSPYTGPIEHYNQTRVISAPSIPFPFYPDLRVALPTPAIYHELRAFDPQVIHFIHPSIFGLVAYFSLARGPYPRAGLLSHRLWPRRSLFQSRPL